MLSPDDDAGQVFHSRFNRVIAVLIWLISGLIGAAMLFERSGPHYFSLVPIAFTVVLTLECLWLPDVRVNDDGVELTNVVRSVQIPWAALVHIDTKYSLTLFTPGRKHTAWAAPAPGRSMGYRNSSAGRDVRRLTPNSSHAVRPSDLVTSESGEAAYLVRRRWEQLQKAGRIEAGVAQETQVIVRWHWITLVVLIGLGLAVIPAALIG